MTWLYGIDVLWWIPASGAAMCAVLCGITRSRRASRRWQPWSSTTADIGD